ncbi:beta-4C adrenergic receptor-like [Patiria miniata]|uniref:G-protein coupled receptors family 1 profile domain-containing protein n=1 Tax=Patiria miniata TaxID=46514 RepID=A0A913ZTD4_PATMI|nr:beta-4C adrenergic receptor-like [Patiria miniata]
MTAVTLPQTTMDLGFYNASPFNVSTTPESGTNDYVTNVMRLIFVITETALLLTLNPLCLLALSHVHDTVQDTTKVFLRSMTAADLGVGIFVAFPMIPSVIYGGWPFGDALCGMQSFLLPFCVTGSLLSLLLLSVDRYISVVYALRYHSLLTLKRARIMACAAWAVVLCTVTGYGHLSGWRAKYFDYSLCCIFYIDGGGSYTYMQVTYTIILLSCLLTLAVVYTRLYLISRQHACRIHVDNQPAGQGNRLARPATKTLHTMLLIALSALFFNLLPIIFFTMIIYNNSAMLTLFLFVLPVLTNSWVNVVIYYLRNGEIRRATFNLLVSCYKCCKRCTHFNPN